MIKFQTNHRSRDVVFLKGKFHEFGTEHSIEVQDVAVDHRLDDRQVGATYEDNFLREVEQLGERQCKPLARFDEECYISSNL